MSKMSDRLKQCSRPASSVKHSRKIAYVVSRSKSEKKKKKIEPLVKQNQRERDASYEEARNKIVR